MSLKQKLHFGTKRQRNSAKASLRRKRANPKHRARRAAPRKITTRRRRSNPAHILALGFLNPTTGSRKSKRSRKRMTSTKKIRRRHTAKANPRRRRRNAAVKVYVHRRNARRGARRNPRRRMIANYRRHRNPSLFGHQVGAFELVKAIAGGLAGVAITKAVPNMLPASIAASSPFTSSLVSIGVAVGAGMLVSALVKTDPMLGYAVGFGGLMQAGSVMLNSFLPSVGTYIGLQGLGNGMGDLVAGKFPVPMNPIMAGQQLALPAPAVTPAAAHAASSGVGAIFNPFGRAM
jgi:hypothetical protein